MQSSARANYLATEVMTATPQKLQLMMIEAAIRSAEQARAHWQAGNDEGAYQPLIHAQQIVGELMAAVNRDAAPELTSKVASVYMFIFRSLVEANYRHDEKKIDEALRVLEEERRTWQQVCEKLGSQLSPDDQAAAPSDPAPDAVSESGLSLEA